MNKLIITLGLVAIVGIASTAAIKCVQCDLCSYSQAVGIAATDCADSNAKVCHVMASGGSFSRGCATSCGAGIGRINGNEEGIVQCCDKDGCNSARAVYASAPVVALLAGLLAFVRL